MYLVLLWIFQTHVRSRNAQTHGLVPNDSGKSVVPLHTNPRVLRGTSMEQSVDEQRTCHAHEVWADVPLEMADETQPAVDGISQGVCAPQRMADEILPRVYELQYPACAK